MWSVRCDMRRKEGTRRLLGRHKMACDSPASATANSQDFAPVLGSVNGEDRPGRTRGDRPATRVDVHDDVFSGVEYPSNTSLHIV